MLDDATQLSRFLLMYRSRSAVSTIVVEANSLADALTQAADFGLNAPTFRLGQELEGKLAALVRPEQVNRILWSRNERAPDNVHGARVNAPAPDVHAGCRIARGAAARAPQRAVRLRQAYRF
jgi:hypothetical protein